MTQTVRFGEWISEGFQLLKKEWVVWVLVTLIYFIPVGVFQFTTQWFGSYFNIQIETGTVSLQEFIQQLMRNLFGSFALGLFGSFAVNIVQAFFYGGLYRMAFKQIRGESIGVADLFSGLDLFIKILVAAVLITVIEFIATLMCFFPLFIARGMLFFTFPLIVRQNLEPLDAIRESFRAAQKEWLLLTVFVFVLVLLSIVGFFACCVGLLFSYPLIFTVNAVAYRDWFEPELKAASPEHRFCNQCGAALNPGSEFCAYCGSRQ